MSKTRAGFVTFGVLAILYMIVASIHSAVQPDIINVTSTATVSVPGPTTTKTVKAPYVPDSCKVAIQAAADFVSDFKSFEGNISPVLDLVNRAYSELVNNKADELSSTRIELNNALNAASQTEQVLIEHVLAFDTAHTACNTDLGE